MANYCLTMDVVKVSDLPEYLNLVTEHQVDELLDAVGLTKNDKRNYITSNYGFAFYCAEDGQIDEIYLGTGILPYNDVYVDKLNLNYQL